MDMKRTRKRPSPSNRSSDLENDVAFSDADRNSNSNIFKLLTCLCACLALLPLLYIISAALRYSPLLDSPQSTGFLVKSSTGRISEAQNRTGGEENDQRGLKGNVYQLMEVPSDKLLGGLLIANFDESSCLSRFSSILYRKVSPYEPSSYLIEKLRAYEILHKRCGPNTEIYNKTLDHLKVGKITGTAECHYVIWISFSGLGNRILTLASTFLYALLTNKVLLVDRGGDIGDLLCEPFPETSWLLSPDFPLISQFGTFDDKYPKSFGNMLKNNIISYGTNNISSEWYPVFAYLHLAYGYGYYDKLFFCEQDQLLLQKIPWLILKSDNYFVPSLFLIPMFEKELAKLFPQRYTVFHQLGRYLFHPTNAVWGLIVRFYQAYLANADEKIGLQVRVFDSKPGPFQHVIDQILACTSKESLLPDVSNQDPVTNRRIKPKTIVVLVTSLNSGYFEKIRDMYWENPTVNGEIVRVIQPSHEEYQQTQKQMHNMKALAEMYLLSLMDRLVTSSWSTFGYVAQGIGGLKPWILFKPENKTVPDPPCGRAMSMEPCFHAPPFYDCKARRGTDTGAFVPYVRHCEDVSWGLKVVAKE